MKRALPILSLLLPTTVPAAEPPEANNLATNQIVSLEVVTAPFLVERTYKSMEGPVQSVFFTPEGVHRMGGRLILDQPASAQRQVVETRTGMAEGPLRERELWWFLGGEIEVLDGQKDEVISQEYMCHFNLDVSPSARRANFPESPGEATRMLTLTGGAMRAVFPPGHGVPAASDEPLQCVFQVLNHNTPGKLEVRHRFTFWFARDRDLQSPMKPLTFHSPFMALPVEAPGAKPFAQKVKKCSCCAKVPSGKNAPVNTSLGIYRGPGGKPYTGHWVVPRGKSVTTFPLQFYAESLGVYETTIHTIIPHVHPYATTFDIIRHDPACGTSELFHRAKIENRKGVTGLKHIDVYSDPDGLKIRPGEQYEFSLTYDNTSNTLQDAMGSMFIYTHDKRWKHPRWNESRKKTNLADQANDKHETEIRIDTTAGSMTARLFPSLAPRHVAKILALVEAGAYDRIPFLNSPDSFVLQTESVERKGDLTNAQRALIGTLPLEASPDARHLRGSLSMARAPDRPDSATTSFCLLRRPAPHLDGAYTVFGQVVQGLEILDLLAERGSGEAASELRINSIEILERGDAKFPAEAITAKPAGLLANFQTSFSDELISCGVEPLDKSKRVIECTTLPGGRQYLHVVTGLGEIAIELLPEVAPKHVAQVKLLADAGCYDGVKIGRIEKGFVAQVDEVRANPNGLHASQRELLRPIPLEVSKELKHTRGVLSMARHDDPNSAESSFSFLFGEAPHLDGHYTIFGKIAKGHEVLDKIEELSGPAPRTPLASIPIYTMRSVKP